MLVRGPLAFLFAFLIAAALNIVAAAPSRVSFVWPNHIVSDTEKTRWIVRVEHYSDHRVLVLSAEDEGGAVRVSKEQLDGEEAALIRFMWWTALPAGEYMVFARVYGEEGLLGVASVPLIVTSSRP